MLNEQGEGEINTHKGKQMLSEQGEGADKYAQR